MATSKLEHYNNALQLIGQRRISSLSVDDDPRHYLDAAYDADAIAYCLEISKPVFATKSVELDSSVVSTETDLDNVFTLPIDYIVTVEVFSDAKFNQPITRYVIESNKLLTDYATVYLRYISNDSVTTLDYWTPTFIKLFSAFLAKEICPKVAPTYLEGITTLFLERLESVRNDPMGRVTRSTATTANRSLSASWISVYNDALMILGLDEITSAIDDSDRRAKLDTALNSGIVAELLESDDWSFANYSDKAFYNASYTPAFGYTRVHDQPPKMHRLIEVYSDEEMETPLTVYRFDDEKFHSMHDEIYIEYISTDYLSNPSVWPTYFKRLVSARLAKDVASGLAPDKLEVIRGEYAERELKARTLDEGQLASRGKSPSFVLTESWLKIYNDALLILGRDEIVNVLDDSNRKVKLDRALNAGIVAELLEERDWSFSLDLYESDSDVGSQNSYGYIYGHDKPANMHRLVEVYSDAKMESPLSAYRYGKDTFYTDSTKIFIEFVDNTYLTDPDTWPTYFKRLVAARLAKNTALALLEDKNLVRFLSTEYTEREEKAYLLDESQVATKGRLGSFTLTNSWLKLYNDALLVMGLDEITSLTDDSNRKVKIDRALNAGLVDDLLQDYPWLFATIMIKSSSTTAATDKGYPIAHSKPSDLHRVYGLYTDEAGECPLKRYRDEGDFFYSSETEFYLEYVTDTVISDPDLWPVFFRRMVASKIAVDTSPSLRVEGADVQNSMYTFDQRESQAKNNDAVGSPPKVIKGVSTWTRSRGQTYGRGRP